MSLIVVILAAGKGTRMRSQLPKVMHEVGGKSMLSHTITTAKSLGAEKVIVVYGHGGEQVKESINDDIVEWVEQAEQLGTGHAVQQAIPNFTPQDNESVMVLYGDVPLVKTKTLQKLLDVQKKDSMCILTTKLDDPSGYGRIVRNHKGYIQKIVEEKDADDLTKSISEINTGILCASSNHLTKWLGEITNDNQQQEYYLTDCIGLAVKQGKTVDAVVCPDSSEVMGVNSRANLAEVEKIYQSRLSQELMMRGVTLRDPDSLYIEGNIEVEHDIVIEPNVVLRGDVKLSKNVFVSANCVIIDSIIATGSIIHPNTVIEGASIGENCEIGPFARVRPDAELAKEVKVGNFVEVKKSTLAEGAKVNHLSYIGDASIGKKTNIGAGTICCNYDGATKHKTIIGDNVFIGSDTQLVAPVKIEDGATIGAGSTITKDVPQDKLTLSRSKQITIENWRRPQKK
ncbi:MAG: bifunctional UDP-N-acetylglucosamine diphosphorylase/glucosamine-1-phosphate N-acetyltransferase GlmU [Pseudomonadota bacterium]